jgi:hypothetical protein
MQLTPEQQSQIRERYGVIANERCDACSQVLGWIRFTRRGEPGEFCSRKCRDGQERPAKAQKTLEQAINRGQGRKRNTSRVRLSSLTHAKAVNSTVSA